MIQEKTLKRLLIDYKEDARNYLPPANIKENPALAAMQVNLISKINTLEMVLEMPLSKFPLVKKIKK